MKRSTMLRLGTVGSLAIAAVAVSLAVKSDPTFLAGDNPVPAQVPLYMRDSVPPLNMLVMGKDHKIYYEAYNDASDLDGDGVVDVGYRGWELKSTTPVDGSSPYKIDYYGYFDSFLCYSWNGNEFAPTGGRTTDKQCSGNWSGDFLNYATMSRMDALRRVLYGGFRAVDTAGRTVLQGAFFPQDAHSWGKEYASVARDGYHISDYTPLPLPEAGRYHLFAITTRSGNLNAYPAYQAPMFRVLRNTTARIWNWVAIEGPVAGDRCFAQGTWCASGGTSTPHPGHPASRAQFDEREEAWALSEYRLGSGSVTTINCNTNCGMAQDDNFLTVIEGRFRTQDGAGTARYQFATLGDDAVDFRISQTNGSVIGDAGWYNGHGTCAPTTNGNGCENDHATPELTLSGGTDYLVKFRHEEGGGDANYLLRYRTRSGGGNNWGNWQTVPASSGTGETGLFSLTRSVYTLVQTTGAASFDPDRYVRVEACPGNADYRDATCKAYPSGSHKPVGILHDYGEGQRMYFGLIAGSQANNIEGGVLRRNIENFANEVNANTGVYTDVEGIVRNIDRLRMIGGSYSGGGDNIGQQKNWNWAGSEGGLGGNCESQGGRALNNGECRMWGNPIAEMMFEAVRYFAGAGAATSRFSGGGSSEGRAEDTHLGLAAPAWSDPYLPGGGGYPACSRPVMTVVSDINPSYDGDLPGNPWSTVAADTALPGFNAADEGQAIWTAEGLGASRNVFIGETPALNDGAPTAKAASSLGNIRGLAPEEPTKGGTYYAASVARYGALSRLNSRADYPYLTTYSVALASPLPRMEIPVGDRTVELLPFAKTVSGTFGEHARKPVNTIVDFFVEELVNFPGGEGDPDVNGGRPRAVFRINYEDVEQGNDHDMDAIVRYTITADAGDTVTVRLDSEYAAGSANQNIGYVISGTTDDGVYLEVRDIDNTNQQSSAYELNTPTGVSAGGCISAMTTAPCNQGLGLTATRTFTPGNAGVGEKLRDPLWYAAKYGTPSTVNADENGDGEPDNYFLVTNPLTMRAQLSKAFDSAAALDLELGSQSISGARVGGGGASFTLQPSFKRERNGKDWTGNVTAIGVNPDGTLGDALWSASAGIPAPAARDIFTIHTMGSGTSATIGASAFTDAALPGDEEAKLNLLGITPVMVIERYGGDYTANDFIDYIVGGRDNEAGRGGTLRARSSVLGSIINSEPVIGSPRSNFGYAMYSHDMFSEYSAFLTAKRATDTYVYVGANDGMLHAFNGNTEPCPGQQSRTCAASGAGSEEFAFIPNGVLNNASGNNIGDLALPDEIYDHRYYVDGQIAISDAKRGSEWKTLLAATAGAGGRSIFALDVTNPGGFSASNVLWERNNKIDQDIGYIQGRPLIVPLQDGSWGVLFGNGFGGNQSDPSLYILDAFTGSVIKKITADDGAPATMVTTITDWICEVGLTCALKTNPFNGLGQITAIDKNGDGRVDAVYGADLQGNLWKFDLSGSETSAWGVAYGGEPLFTAEVGGERQPITGGIRVSAGPGAGVMVFFGTGRYLYQSDNTVPESPQLQSLYGIYDNGSAIPSQTGIGGRGSLGMQTITAQVTNEGGQTVRNLSRNVVAYYGTNARRGWYVDLAIDGGSESDFLAVGERFIATPRIQSGRVFFTSYTPLEDSCSPGGLNFAYGLDLLSGAGALSDVRVLPSDEAACTGGNCGAVAIGNEGSAGEIEAQPPVMGTGVVAINPVTLVDSTCTGASCASFEQCEVVIYPGAFVLPRPCGRQSWRQLR
ncbi:PilC/PilY family type IV pilus protein [Luteimonas sp. MJ246]|uniref:pilus assembly protein n=1 Tax=Luteimonas sp. MJ174 TaxID=3129237 RepID=UPI0031BB82F5